MKRQTYLGRDFEMFRILQINAMHSTSSKYLSPGNHGPRMEAKQRQESDVADGFIHQNELEHIGWNKSRIQRNGVQYCDVLDL